MGNAALDPFFFIGAPKRTDDELQTLRASGTLFDIVTFSDTQQQHSWLCSDSSGMRVLTLAVNLPHGVAALCDAPFVVLYWHGNAQDCVSALTDTRALFGPDAAVVCVEYPGYGDTPRWRAGASQFDDAKASALAAWHHVHNTCRVDARRIVLAGRSLGTGVAVYVARQVCNGERPLSLVLISPYTGLVPLARHHSRLAPLLVREHLNSRAALRTVDVPLLVLHGTRDDVVPYDQGDALVRDAAAAQKLLIPLRGCGHNRLFLTVDNQADAQVKVAQFLRAAS